MKKYKIVAIIFVLIVLIAVFFHCSSIGVSGSAHAGETTGGAVDTSPIPANSEFLNE